MVWIFIKVLIADKIKAYLLIFFASGCRKRSISSYKTVLLRRVLFSFNICFAKRIK